MIKLYYRLINRLKRLGSHLTWKKIVLLGVFLLLIFCIASRFLFYFEKKNWDNRPGEINLKFNFITYIPNITNVWNGYRYFLPSDLPKYQLLIGGKEIKELEEALPDGFFDPLPEDSTWVPATFIAEGKKYKVKIKYRGLMSRHWQYREKSWHIKFTKEYFKGYDELYFILPEEKDFLVEDFGYHLAEKLDLITPDSYFVRLKVNHESYGAYLVLEGWGSDFLERHNLSTDANFYREGEDIEPRLFEDSVNWKKYTSESHTDALSWEKYKKETHSEISNFADLDLLVSCLNKCSNQEFYDLASKIIDLDNFLRWQAHTAIMGDDHQDSWHNIRLYFDPIIGKFKFIPYDVNTFKFGGQLDIVYNPLVAKLLTYPDLIHRRNKIIWDYINNEENIRDDLNYYQDLYRQTKSAFYRDRIKRFSNWYFNFRVKDRLDKMAGQYQYLKELLESGVQDGKEKEIQIKVYNFENRVAKFQVLVNTFSDLFIKNLSTSEDLEDCEIFYDANRNEKFDSGDNKISEFSKNSAADRWQTGELNANLFAERKFLEPLSYEELLPINLTAHTFFIVSGRNRLLAENSFDFEIINAVTGRPMKADLRFYDLNVFSRLDDINLSSGEFAEKNGNFISRGSELILPAGSYIFEKTAVIPENLTLRIEGGAKLFFAAGVSLVSYSPILAEGEKSRPIIFQSIVPGEKWGVVAVVSADEKQSRFQNCLFYNGKDIYLNGIYFSGMLSLHQSDAEIENCTFAGAAGDDSLHVVNAKGVVRNSKFVNNSFDAIDLDYCQGEIYGSYFGGNGNDAIDLSGSDPLIYNNFITLSGDKGISIGEKSHPRVAGNLILENKIGVEVKDASIADLINNTILKNQIGINGYRKKELYVNGGKANIFNSIIWNNADQIALDEFSEIEINNSLIQGGWPKGANNVDLAPNFRNEKTLEYFAVDSELKPYLNREVLSEDDLAEFENLGISQYFFSDNVYFNKTDGN